MKVTHPISARSLGTSKYWLLGMITALTAIYMTLVWLSGDTAHLGMSFLFYLTAGIVLWEKLDSLQLQSSLFSKIMGAMLVTFALWQSIGLIHDPELTSHQLNPVLRLFPFITALAVGLVASGWRGLTQYRQELILLFFLGGPSILFTFLPDFSPITAQFSTSLLMLAGFNASVEGIYIYLPTGAVKVYAGCSGVESMTYLLGLSVVALTLFPLARIKQIFVPILAMAIGFIVNSIRVAVMAVLVASHNQAAFAYWHQGRGSLIFGVVEVLVFGFCYGLMHKFSTDETLETEVG